ncbi:MAG: triose-phosphate isomerase [Betaproteobacteria bacterium]|nr:triose-phosphate isomerase [Betaproteobacteria bacterium]MBI2509504.1 triose-phosphate isomerase [Betaproteobacteria bacterium]
MRIKLVAGNWKMNGTLASSRALLEAVVPALAPLKRANFAVCSPFPHLGLVQQALRGSNVALGAQDVCQHDNGAYTGGVSAAMLADLGCRYVIVGHSERRAVFGDSDELVALKYAAAVRHRLTPILCVGETLAERESGVTEKVVARQLDAVIGHCGAAALERGVVAYEPVWAIGTGRNATPEQAQAVHEYVRGRLAAAGRRMADAACILYGGSVKAANAAQLFAMPDVDGGLIGGASLVAGEFVAICRAAQSSKETVKS